SHAISAEPTHCRLASLQSEAPPLNKPLRDCAVDVLSTMMGLAALALMVAAASSAECVEQEVSTLMQRKVEQLKKEPSPESIRKWLKASTVVPGHVRPSSAQFFQREKQRVQTSPHGESEDVEDVEPVLEVDEALRADPNLEDEEQPDLLEDPAETEEEEEPMELAEADPTLSEEAAEDFAVDSDEDDDE
ncbi:unnamed protein product, partial [Durusdinium trenchii]